MRSKKRVLPAALSVLLPAVAMLSACSSSTGSGKAGEADGSAAKTPEARTITVMRSDSSIQPVLKDSPALKQILAKTNVKVNMEGVPSSDYEAKKKTLIATNNIPDVLHVSRTDITNYASTGIFLNLSPFIDKYAPNLKKRLESEPEASKLKIDGNFYGFPIMLFPYEYRGYFQTSQDGDLIVNGRPLALSEELQVYRNADGALMLPLRMACEALELAVTWDESRMTAVVSERDKLVLEASAVEASAAPGESGEPVATVRSELRNGSTFVSASDMERLLNLVIAE